MIQACFGKLPLSPEFIRVNAGGETVEAFDQWIQESMCYARDTWQTQWKETFLRIRPWHFLYSIQGNAEFLIGCCMASQDQAGRVFPFMIFLRGMYEEEVRPFEIIPAWVSPFLQDAMHLCEKGWKTETLPSIRVKIQGLTVPDSLTFPNLSEQYRQFLSSHFWSDLALIVKQDTGMPLEQEMQGIQGIYSRHHTHRSYQDETIRVPLASKDWGFVLGFWLSLVPRLRRKDLTDLAVCWRVETKPWGSFLILNSSSTAPRRLFHLLQPSDCSKMGEMEDGQNAKQRKEGHFSSDGRASDDLTKTLSLERILRYTEQTGELPDGIYKEGWETKDVFEH